MKRLPSIEIWILTLIVIVGAGLRFYDLGAKSLWYDEIYEFQVANKGIAYIGQELSYEFYALRQSPINLFIAYLSLSLNPDEFFLRLPSALWGISGILGIYLIGKVFFGSAEGVLSAFLLAISSFHIRYSQEGRMYALLVLASLLANYFFWRALLKNKKRYWLGYIVWSILSIYTHLFAMFLILSQTVYLGLGCFRKFFKRVADQWEKKRTAFLLGLLIILAASSPRLIMVGRHVLSSTKPWVAVNIGAIAKPTGRIRVTPIPILMGLYGAGRGFPLFLYAGFFILGFLGSVKKSVASATYLFLVIVLPFCVFMFIKPSQLFSPRYLIFLVPIYYIVIARGITCLVGYLKNIRPRCRKSCGFAIYSVVIACFLLCGIRPLRMYYLESRDPDGRLFKPDWKGLVSFMEDNIQPGDMIVPSGSMAYYDRVCLRQYLSPGLQERMTGVVPEDMTGCGIWRFGRDYGARTAPSADAKEKFIASPVPGIAISRALYPVDLRLKKTLSGSFEGVKIAVRPEKVFRFSILVKGAERHFEGFSPSAAIYFHDSSSRLVPAPNQGMPLITEQKNGWKRYVIGGMTPPGAEYATVSFHKFRAHVGDEFELAEGEFYGDWEG